MDDEDDGDIQGEFVSGLNIAFWLMSVVCAIRPSYSAMLRIKHYRQSRYDV
jgi:hypothetical protein